MQLQVGDIATWVGAVGTTGAFAVSLILLSQALKDRRVSQAQRVAAWQLDIQPASQPASSDVSYEAVITYRLINNNDTPIYNIVLGARCGVHGNYVRQVGSLGPHETRDVRVYLPSPPRTDQYPPDIAFTDNAGRVWYRNGCQGALKQIDVYKVSKLINVAPGAYGSLDKHPTLYLK